MNGFAKIHRQIFEHPLFGVDPVSRYIFIDLFTLAAWQPTVQDWRGKPVEIGRGQIMISVAKLATMTAFTDKQVRNALKKLCRYGCIEAAESKGKAPAIITICNYDKFQGKPEFEGNMRANERANQIIKFGEAEGKATDSATNCNYDIFHSSGRSEGEVAGNVLDDERANPGANKIRNKEEKIKTRVPACAPTREYNTTTEFNFSAEAEHPQLAKQTLTEPSMDQSPQSLVSSLNVAPAPVTPNPVSVSSEQIDLEGAIEAAKMRDALTGPPRLPSEIFYADGVVTLTGAARASWQRKFGTAERLDLALLQIAPYIQPNGNRPLAAQVVGQLARQLAQKMDSDERYKAAAQSKPQHPVDREEAANRAYYDELKRKYKVGEYAGTA